jgi:hypothetical protein
MARPTQEELDDEAQRTRPIAYFNFAETYWTAAKALRRSRARATHKDSPIRFLYYHAIELYLKAHLRARDIHPYEMRNKFGHDVGKLSRKSAGLGLQFDDKDLDIFHLMSKTDAVIRSRYILTGAFTWPDIGELNALVSVCAGPLEPFRKRWVNQFGCRASSGWRRIANAQLVGVTNGLGVGLGVKDKGGWATTRRGLGGTTAGAGTTLAVASRGTDLRRRISMRRRCGISPGALHFIQRIGDRLLGHAAEIAELKNRAVQFTLHPARRADPCAGTPHRRRERALRPDHASGVLLDRHHHRQDRGDKLRRLRVRRHETAEAAGHSRPCRAFGRCAVCKLSSSGAGRRRKPAMRVRCFAPTRAMDQHDHRRGARNRVRRLLLA